jgi:hypothetical protein
MMTKTGQKYTHLIMDLAIVSIINVQVTAIIDFIIPADNYNQTLLITCQHYAHGTLYYNIHV